MNIMQEYQYQPVILFMNDGEIYFWENPLTQFNTCYFLITKLWKDGCELTVLEACTNANNNQLFNVTEYTVQLDSRMFCGYHLLEHATVTFNKEPVKEICDTFSGVFAIYPGYRELVLWRSNLNAGHSGVLYIDIKLQDKSSANIILQQTNGESIFPLKDGPIHLSQCQQIILRTNGKLQLKGDYQLEVKGLTII